MNYFSYLKYCGYLSLIFWFCYGCKPDNSLHEIVDVSNPTQELGDKYISYLKEQIENDPEISDNYVKLSSIYLQQGQEDEAISLLQKASHETSEDTRILLELGKLYLHKQDAQKLSEVLKAIRNYDPENIEFLKLSAGYSLLLSDYTNAIFFANRAILANPFDDETIHLLARAKLINKDSITALNDFEEAYRLKSSWKNFSSLFHLSLSLKETEKAKSYLKEFEDNNPEINDCYYWGAYYNSVNKKDSARALLKNCNQIEYTHGRINYELAKSYYPTDTDSVLLFVNEFLNERPEDIRGLVLKAKTLENIKYYTEARNLYQAAIKIDSTSTLAVNGLENLERKVAYLRLVERKEKVRKEFESLKPLNSKEIN